MDIKEILNKKKTKEFDKSERKTLEDMVLSVYSEQNIDLNKREKETLFFYLKQNQKDKTDRDILDTINILLKDKNDKTINIKGRIVAELKKKNIVESLPEFECKYNILTNIRVRHISFFSPRNRKVKGRIENEAFVIRRFNTTQGSLTHYNVDLTHFDEKVVYVICTMSKEQNSRKIEFTLKEICRKLNIPENGAGVRQVVKSIRDLKRAEFEIEDFLLEDGVKRQEAFSFLDNYRLITGKEKTRYEKSYVYLNVLLFEQLVNKKYIKKMDEKYLRLTNGYEFKIFSYLDILNKKSVTLKLETLLTYGLSIEKEVLEDKKKLNSARRQINRALKNLKEKKYIKSYKAIGRGKDRIYKFKM